MVTFAWPWLLVALAAVPLVVVWYRRLLRTRAARRAELAALGLAGPAPGRRAALPPALLLGALALLLLALARPEIGVPLPRREGTVMLAFDVSSSMTATDLSPDADGRRQGRGARRRRAPTAHRAGGGRRVRHQRARHPAADRGPGERARRDRPAPAGRGHGAGQRAADLAERDHREDGAGRTRRARRTESRRRARTSATTAPRPSSCSPTARTRPSRTRSRSPTSRPARACASTRSGSGRRAAP